VQAEMPVGPHNKRINLTRATVSVVTSDRSPRSLSRGALGIQSSRRAMVRFGRTCLLAVVVTCLLALAACGSASSPSPVASSSSSSSPPPLAQLSRLANHFRSSQGATQAWWVKVPLSEANGLLGGSWASPSPSPGATAPVYVVLLKGDYTGGDGKPYHWAVAASRTVGQTGESTLFVTNHRPDTHGQPWTPLPLASP